MAHVCMQICPPSTFTAAREDVKASAVACAIASMAAVAAAEACCRVQSDCTLAKAAARALEVASAALWACT